MIRSLRQIQHYSTRAHPFAQTNDSSTRNTQLDVLERGVKHFLSANSKIFSGSYGSKQLSVHVASLPGNAKIEDSWSIMSLAKSKKVTGTLAGVFDGHWSHECSTTVSRELPLYIKNRINNETDIPSSDRIVSSLYNAFVTLDNDLLELPSKSIPDFDKLTSKQISNLSQEIRREATSKIMPALTGACGLVGYVTDDQADLYIANAGDCRAVLGSRDTTHSGQVKYIATDLSTDHQPSNPKELERLRKEHPGEERTVVMAPGRTLRVLGGLMPSRSFGDGKYKWPLETSRKVDSIDQNLKRNIPTQRYCLTPPYITAAPEITHTKLDSNKDEFIILATDGLYECLTSQGAVEAVGSLISHGEKTWPPWPTIIDSDQLKKDPKFAILRPQGPLNLASNLIRAACLGVGVSTSSESGEALEVARQFLMLPPGEARNYRDDMTVVVIVLHSGLSRSPKFAHDAMIPEI